MAFSLTKAEQKVRDDLMGKLEAAAATLDAAVSEFNDVLTEISEFRDDIVARAREEIEEKSEKWQESEAAERADAWVETWGDDFEPVEIDTSEYTVAFEDLPVSSKE